MTRLKYLKSKLPNETLLMEYKQFTLSLIHRDLQKILCKNSKLSDKYILKFNSMIYHNLLLYLKKYIPKYISGFINSKLNGCIKIGVHDNGQILGIPFFGNFNQTEMNQAIYKIIDDNIVAFNITNGLMKVELDHDIIDIKIVNINKPDDNVLLDNYNITNCGIDKNNFNKRTFDISLINYLRTNNYNIKLKEIFSNSFKFVSNIILTKSHLLEDFITFIKNNDPMNKLINELEDKLFFNIDLSNSKNILTFDHNIYKIDTSTIQYWLVTYINYKRHIIENTLKNKKIPKLNPKIKFYERVLINNLREIIPYWWYLNPNMQLFLIEVKLINIPQNIITLYNDDNSVKQQYRQTYRIDINNNPLNLDLTEALSRIKKNHSTKTI